MFVFTSPLYLKGKPVTQDVIWKGYRFPVISSLLPVSFFLSFLSFLLHLIWFLGKIRKNSQKIDLNRKIRQRIFRFEKFEFFGSIESIFNFGSLLTTVRFGPCAPRDTTILRTSVSKRTRFNCSHIRTSSGPPRVSSLTHGSRKNIINYSFFICTRVVKVP